jgi:hypothetical protein
MPRVSIPLGQNFGKGRSNAPSLQSTANMYVEEVKGEDRTRAVLYSTPGMASFATVGGAPRGQITANETHYAVMGTRLYKITSAGVTTDLGEIEGSSLVDMSFNGNQIDIVAELKSYSYDTLTLALSEITDPNFEQAAGCASLASYSIYQVKGTGRFRWRLTNSSSFNALDFATAEAESDNLRAIRRVGNELALLGNSSVEWWYPTGSSAPGDAFAKTSTAAASIGCDSRDTAIVFDSGLIWVGRDGLAGGRGVYRAEGYTPRKISPPQVDNYLEQVSNPFLLRAFSYQQRGHLFYVLTYPDEWTLAWDIATNQWAYRKSGTWSMGADPLGGWDAITFGLNGTKQIVGKSDGNLYELDLDILDELGRTTLVTPGATYTYVSADSALREQRSYSSIMRDTLPNAGGAGFESGKTFYVRSEGSTILINGGGNDSYCKSLLQFEGADATTVFTDTAGGGSGHAWTAAGNAQIDTAVFKFGTAAGLFDGTGDYISTPDSSDFALGSSDFTIDLWFNCTAAAGSVQRICGQADNVGSFASMSFLIRRTAANIISAGVSFGSSETSVSSTTTYTNAVNTGWHHLAFVRNGTNLYLFLDGVLEGSRSDLGTSSVVDSSNELAVGRFGEVAGSEWTGSLDQFRFSVGIARWTAAFTPPPCLISGQTGLTILTGQEYKIVSTGSAYTASPYEYRGLTCEVTTPQFHQDGKRIFESRLELDIEAGVGLESGQGSAPYVEECHSDDGGQTWSRPRAASMGAIGQSKYRAVWYGNGSYRQRMRKFRCSDPVRVVFLSAWADINVGAV